MKWFLAPKPIWLEQAQGLIRIAIGAMVIYHGLEVFDPKLMNEYAGWETFKGPSAKLLVYMGKVSELLAGIFLFLGLFTRLGALMLIGTLGYVTFFVGQGRFWYEDQHPFMFVVVGILYFFSGPGSWNLDALIFRRS